MGQQSWFIGSLRTPNLFVYSCFCCSATGGGNPQSLPKLPQSLPKTPQRLPQRLPKLPKASQSLPKGSPRVSQSLPKPPKINSEAPKASPSLRKASPKPPESLNCRVESEGGQLILGLILRGTCKNKNRAGMQTRAQLFFEVFNLFQSQRLL